MRKTFYLFFVACFCLPVSADLYRAKYDRFISLSFPLIKRSLVLNEVCKDENDCNKKSVVFFESSKNNLKIYLYGIKDLKTVKDILEEVLLVYDDGGFSVPIKLEVYEDRKSVRRKNLFSILKSKKSPFFTMIIRER